MVHKSRVADQHISQGCDLALLEYLTYVARVPNALISVLGNHRDNVIAFALHVLRTSSVTFNVIAINNGKKASPAVSSVTLFRLGVYLIILCR